MRLILCLLILGTLSAQNPQHDRFLFELWLRSMEEAPLREQQRKAALERSAQAIARCQRQNLPPLIDLLRQELHRLERTEGHGIDANEKKHRSIRHKAYKRFRGCEALER
jgi:hypothetical protein